MPAPGERYLSILGIRHVNRIRRKDMAKQQSYNLWRITRGQRARYGAAVLAMALMNGFMFGAPLVGKYAIDLVVERDFAYATASSCALA